MLFALRQPATFLGLVLGFAVGSALRAALQQAVVGGLRSVRRIRHPRFWLDPYGCVSAAIGGVGWAPRPTINRFKPRQVWTVIVVALLAHAALAAAGFAWFAAAGGSLDVLQSVPTLDVLHGLVQGLDVAQRVALGFAIANLSAGLLVLLPIPPLELGVALWSTLPKTASSRRLAYRLLEEHWGVLVVLVLFAVPLSGEFALLIRLLGDLSDDILGAL
jgi:hypothetical protein